MRILPPSSGMPELISSGPPGDRRAELALLVRGEAAAISRSLGYRVLAQA